MIHADWLLPLSGLAALPGLGAGIAVGMMLFPAIRWLAHLKAEQAATRRWRTRHWR